MNPILSLRRQRGFNLIELMIALVIGLIVVLGATSVFLSNKQSYRTNSAIGQIQENARIAFELLTRDLRQARLTGCGNQATTANLLSDSTTLWYANFAGNGLIAFDGATADSNPALTTGTASGNHRAGTDNITLIGASDLAYSLATHDAATSKLTLNETSPELAVGDLIVICDTAQADIAQISGTTGGFFVATGSGTPGNTAALSKTYLRNAQVSALKSVTWYIGCNPLTALSCDPNRGGTSLYRMAAVGAAGPSVSLQAQEMVRGVAAMDLSFLNTAATDYVDANAIAAATWPLNTVSAVRINLRLVAEDRSSRDAMSASNALQANAMIFRDLNTVVALRNPPI